MLVLWSGVESGDYLRQTGRDRFEPQRSCGEIRLLTALETLLS